jgi:hypothetical protein
MFEKTVKFNPMDYQPKEITRPHRETVCPRFTPCVPLTAWEAKDGCYPSLEEYGIGKKRTDSFSNRQTLELLAALLVLKSKKLGPPEALDFAIRSAIAGRKNSVVISPQKFGATADELPRFIPYWRAQATEDDRDMFLIDQVGPLTLAILEDELLRVDRVELAAMAVRIAKAELEYARDQMRLANLDKQANMARSAQEQLQVAVQATNKTIPELSFAQYIKVLSSI